MQHEVVILPFVLDNERLDLERLQNQDGTYSFRGHDMTKTNIPLPDGYAVQTRAGRCTRLSLLQEVGDAQQISLYKMYEAFKAME